MRDRRPYASRGVPRRASTRSPARRFPFSAVLVGLGVFVVLGVVWAVNPFASAARLTVASPLVPVLQQSSGDQPDSGTAVEPAEVVLPTSVAGVATVPTSAPLQRQWDTETIDGILIDPVLTSRLDQALVGVDGHVGVVVKDLGSDRGAVLNGNLELQSASLYKLPVLFTVFDLGLNMSEELTITDEALSYDAGTMELAAGETLSVAEALERMVTLSDNTSAILLGGRVGANRINANIAALGMETTHYSLERMTTSALDMSRFLELVADGKAVSPRASADMLHLMLRQRVNDRLPRLLPDYVQVAHKTGNLPGVVNDVGILYGPSSTVIVAALVSDTTDETAAATAIAQMGLIANTYFEGLQEEADRPTLLPAPLRAIPPTLRESHPPTPTPVALAASAVPTSAVTPIAPATAAATSAAATAANSAAASAPATRTPVAPTVAPAQAATATPAPPTPTATHVPSPPPTATPVPPPPPTRPPAVTKPTPVPTPSGPAHR